MKRIKTEIIIIGAMVVLLIGQYFFNNASGTNCVHCIYMPNNNSEYTGYYVNEARDTTFYKINLISSSKGFLLQKKLKYIVTRLKDKNATSGDYTSESTTGFTEDSNRIWLHPPRADKFKYITQLAPYPEVLFPMTPGDTIKGKIHMVANWGQWSGKSSEYYLTVADTLLDKRNNETRYILKGCGHILNDISCVEYLFSLSKGFINAHYSFNGKEHFYMELKE